MNLFKRKVKKYNDLLKETNSRIYDFNHDFAHKWSGRDVEVIPAIGLYAWFCPSSCCYFDDGDLENINKQNMIQTEFVLD